VPFRPSNPAKRGYNACLNSYPEYKEDPIKVIQRKKEDPEKEEKAKWK
jgi:hypothetical protein